MFATLLILLAVTAIAVANNPPTHKILVFRNGDLVTNDNPLSNVEVHCFELNNNGEPTYVRGTYGNRGYFEGSVNNWGAFVNYQEISATPEGLTPVAGSGYLGYENTWEYSSGFFWPSGVQSEITPLNSWGISGPCTEGLHPCTGTDNSVDEAAIALQYCFWDITNTLGHSRDNINYKPWTVIGNQNPSTWYKLSVGFQEAFGGALAGAYRYTYSDDDCNNFPNGCTSGRVEWGIYSQETAISGFKTSLGIATEWKATTGPIAGQSGSALYGIVAGPDGKAKQIGFFCNSKINQDPNIDAKKVLAACSPEPGQIQLPDTEGNRKLSKTLFKNYARKEYAYWWRNLFSFIDAVWGEHVHAQDSLTSEEITSAEADNTVKAVEATPVAAAVPPSA